MFRDSQTRKEYEFCHSSRERFGTTSVTSEHLMKNTWLNAQQGTICAISSATTIALLTLSLTVFAQENLRYSDTTIPALTTAQIHAAQIWEITEQEMKRLNQVQLRYSGHLSKDISPLEWLGIFAETDQQREYYAKRFAELQFRVVSAVAEFEDAYAAAMSEIASDDQLRLTNKNKLLLIVPYQCGKTRCKPLITRGLDHVTRGGFLEIHIQTSSTNRDVDEWVEAQQIPQKMLVEGQISVAIARGEMKNIQPGIYRTK